jgi:glycosyltransferase involved in cell wall biosynthesis
MRVMQVAGAPRAVEGAVVVESWPAFANRAANPYNSLLSDALTERGAVVREFEPGWRPTGADVVHLHWPETFLNEPSALVAARRSAKLLVRLARERRRGSRVVWTAHNLSSHGALHPALEPVFWSLFTRLVDGWTTLSETARAAVVDRWPRLAAVPHAVIPHGHYRDAYPDAGGHGRGGARDRDGQTVLLFFGRVKRYKGVPELLRAFTRLPHPDWRLVVAGRCVDADLAAELHVLADEDARIRLDLRDLPEEEVVPLLAGADLLVAPYADILHSGTALLALSFGLPVAVPDKGAMRELQDAVGAAWVRTYEGTITPDVLEQLAAALPPPTAPPDLRGFEWGDGAAATLELYRAVTGR